VTVISLYFEGLEQLFDPCLRSPVIVFRLYFAGLEQVLDLDFPVRIGSDVCDLFFGGPRA
jgi:hypothetical protein